MKNFRKIILIVISIALLAFVFLGLNSGQKTDPETPSDIREVTKPVSENDPPTIISTKPNPLDEAVVSASEVLEFSFNRPLENEGEFKIKTEPPNNYKITLSQDRKTATVTPLKPFELGATYTLRIGPDTKFQGLGEWRQEKIYHFKTIRYRGV